MSFFQDTLSIFKKRELSFIENEQESEGIYTFIFEKEKGLTWKAGQHGLFDIIHKKIKNPTRAFTVASAPIENVVKITTKITDNPSEFKKALLELKKGMKIRMSGPVGSFYLKDQSPSLMIAGGIGITPFRSIIKQAAFTGSEIEKPKHLLYMDSKKSYLFKEEFDEIASNNPSFIVTYLDSRDELHQKINKFTAQYGSEGQYFISGPKSMADSISRFVQNINISKRNIKKDSFFGY